MTQATNKKTKTIVTTIAIIMSYWRRLSKWKSLTVGLRSSMRMNLNILQIQFLNQL